MIPVEKNPSLADPLKELCLILEAGWEDMCEEYDVKAQPPPLELLLNGTNFLDPERAAETITINMLTEVIERVDRFSPWYTLPASAFGLVQERDMETMSTRWILCPEAAHMWQDLYIPLTSLIRKNCGLFRMAVMVDGLWNVSRKAN